MIHRNITLLIQWLLSTYSGNINATDIRYVACALCPIVCSDDWTLTTVVVSTWSTLVTNIRRDVRQLLSQRSDAGRSMR